jgi:hypothetical protein
VVTGADFYSNTPSTHRMCQGHPLTALPLCLLRHMLTCRDHILCMVHANLWSPPLMQQ